MAEHTYITCDECGKTVGDIKTANGWIEVFSNYTLSLTVHAKEAENRKERKLYPGHHFCNALCMVEYISRNIQEL